MEISHDSIVAARRNAEINGLSGDKASWLTGKAEELFVGLPELGFRGEDSCVVVDVSTCLYHSGRWFSAVGKL